MVKTFFESIESWYDKTVDSTRKRSSLFDHFWRAKERYSDVLGGRLSAAIAYYGFFAAFALAVVVYTIVIDVFSGSQTLAKSVDEFLGNYFTDLTIDELKGQVNVMRPIGLVGLVLAGVGWVDAWRSSLRAIWRLDQHPGNFLLLRLVDLGTLIVFGLMMTISLSVNSGLEALFRYIADGKTGTIPFQSATYALTFAVNVVIAFGLLTLLPRMHLGVRRLLPAMVGIAIGLTLLNALSHYVVMRSQNPAYAIVTTTVGLLVYLYAFNQIVIWGTSWAATAQNGRVFDLAWGRPREHDTLGEDELPEGDKP
ncbi:YihY/virulence factor BrkB family protein [Catelliglobosispora koreensis]|uniref:YihY/virulence factor BrkB family protein n=1 Tax=Catelliglobosispora koreensis TaxID=129052 RepID=UPI00037170B8|nr:YihY/virulence factor BrkB family protein [Catelliglobosispora koreensis]